MKIQSESFCLQDLQKEKLATLMTSEQQQKVKEIKGNWKGKINEENV